MTTERLNPVSSKTTIAFCGGGSGGHLFPALAVCDELQRLLEGAGHFLFISTGRAIEGQILAGRDLISEVIPTVTSVELKRNPIRGTSRMWQAIRTCRRLFVERQPAVVVGLGGYGSVPGILAAKSLSIPTLLLEQNRIAGQANRLLTRVADGICLAFPAQETKGISGRITSIETGNPVRSSILQLSQQSSASQPDCLFVLGGSQGARAVNDALLSMAQLSPQVFQGWRVLHQTGMENNELLKSAYAEAKIEAQVSQFIGDIASAYRQATMVVSRAGATSLAELAIVGLPALLVPYPNSVRDHQELNAQYYCDAGAAQVVLENVAGASFADRLGHELAKLLQDVHRRSDMARAMKKLGKPDATHNVAQEILRRRR